MVYLEQVGQQRVLGSGLDPMMLQVTRSESLLVRSVVSDAHGFFSFSGLPKGKIFTIQPKLDGYTFVPSELTMRTGTLAQISSVRQQDVNPSQCSRRNLVALVGGADRRAQELHAYIESLVHTFEGEVRQKMPVGRARDRVTANLVRARVEANVALAQVISESFSLPNAGISCDGGVPEGCTEISYRPAVQQYQRYLIGIRRSGLFGNRIGSLATGNARAGRSIIAREIKRLHARALRAAHSLPTGGIRCQPD
jgi:hypothetical protein